MPSLGYDNNEITESGIPRWAMGVGHPAHVKDPNSFRVTGFTGTTLSLSGGDAWGYGIADYDLPPQDLTVPVAASGVRWDTVVLRRDFTPAGGTGTPGGLSEAVVIEGPLNGAKVLQSVYNVGVEMDAALHLVQAGSGGIVSHEDARIFSGTNLYTQGNSAFLPVDAGVGSRAMVNGADMIYRPATVGGVPAWQTARPAYQGEVPITETMLLPVKYNPGVGVTKTATLGSYVLSSPVGSAPFRVDFQVNLYCLAHSSAIVRIWTRSTGGKSRQVVIGGSDYLSHSTPMNSVISPTGAAITFDPKITVRLGRLEYVASDMSSISYTVTTL